jgi:hypothetical protein
MPQFSVWVDWQTRRQHDVPLWFHKDKGDEGKRMTHSERMCRKIDADCSIQEERNYRQRRVWRWWVYDGHKRVIGCGAFKSKAWKQAYGRLYGQAMREEA